VHEVSVGLLTLSPTYPATQLNQNIGYVNARPDPISPVGLAESDQDRQDADLDRIRLC